jgi:hypothetical protein
MFITKYGVSFRHRKCIGKQKREKKLSGSQENEVRWMIFVKRLIFIHSFNRQQAENQRQNCTQ